MGNKASSSSLKRGGKNARPAQHEYLTKEIIYIDQYLENLTIDMQAYDDVQEDSDKWVEKVGKYKEECSMKTRREKSMGRLKVVSSLIRSLKMDATSRIRKSGINVSDPEDIALLHHLDTIIATSAEFLGIAISDGLTIVGKGAEVTGGAISEGLTIVGKDVGDMVQDLPISKLSNKGVEDLSITTGAAAVLAVETVAVGVHAGTEAVVKGTQKAVKDALKDGSEGMFAAFVEKDRE
eukprot:g15670.t1